MTDFANDLFFKVARPRSPILTDPVGPVMKMLSHLRSRWMTGGDLVCKKWSPFMICRHQDFKTRWLIFLNLLKYVFSVPEVIISVTSTMHFLDLKVGSFSWRHTIMLQSERWKSVRLQFDIKWSYLCLCVEMTLSFVGYFSPSFQKWTDHPFLCQVFVMLVHLGWPIGSWKFKNVPYPEDSLMFLVDSQES